jgi:nucleotide-binding universal stress UspA family protein
MLPIRTILHPTDFSGHSEYAFRLASSLARDYGARLIVLHVFERPLFIHGGVMTAPPEPPPTEEERQAIRKELLGIKPPDAGVCTEHLLEEGDPATGIMQVAQERACDLIVMGSHGRTGLGRLVMGSVAEQVVRKAPCPVLTVKLPEHQEKLLEEAMPATAGRATVTVK